MITIAPELTISGDTAQAVQDALAVPLDDCPPGIVSIVKALEPLLRQVHSAIERWWEEVPMPGDPLEE